MVQRQADKRRRQWEASLQAIDRYRKVGRFRSALPLANRVVRMAESAAERAEAYAAKGLVERGLERYREAAVWLEKARDHYRRLGDVQGEAYVSWGLGGCERFRGKPKRAIGYFREAQQYFLAAGDRHGWTYATYGLAGALRVTGQVALSLRTYRSAWVRCQQHRDRFGIAYGLCGMAHAHRHLAQAGVRSLYHWKEAERCYRQSGVLYRRIGDWSSVGYTSWGLGQAARRGASGQARKLFRRAAREFQKAGDSRGIALARLALVSLGEGKLSDVISWASRRGISKATLNSY